jgi:hypothetical protein
LIVEKTYTYTARNSEDPGQVVTFTLHNHHLSVGLSAPLEQMERALEAEEGGPEEEAEAQLWLRPLAISLVERGVGPFRITDIYPHLDEDWLRVKAWYRAGGLGLMPVTLVDGPVDNAPAAEAFVQEVDRRKEDAAGAAGVLNVLDYWITWFLAAFLFVGLLKMWRKKGQSFE